MGKQEYTLKLWDARVLCKQTLSIIDTFSPEDITSPLDREQLHVNLQRIKDKFLAVTDWMAGVIVDLEANNEEERIHEFEALADNMQRKVNANQQAVKEKRERILVQASNSAAPTAVETIELRMRESKAKIKKDFIGERCNTLQAEIAGYKDATEMSNDEVHFALKESQDWKKESSEIVGLQQTYLEGCVSLGKDGDQQEVRDAVNNLLYNVNRKVQSLGDENKR